MISLFLLLSIAASGTQASAGPRVIGNGGISIVCRDSETLKINKAFLLDLFEADNSNLTIVRSEEPVQAQVQNALARLNSKPGIKTEIQRQLKLIENTTVFLQDPRVGLPLTDDALPRLRLKGCTYEQLAIYDSSTDVLTVDQEIYSSLNLSRSDAAALWLHEAIYKTDRWLNDAKDSRASRALTSSLFAKNSDSPAEEFSQRFSRLNIQLDEATLWMSLQKNYSIDLEAYNMPAGTLCRAPRLSLKTSALEINDGQTFYPLWDVLQFPWTEHAGPFLNGSTQSMATQCNTLRDIDFSKAYMILNIRENETVVMRVRIDQFYRVSSGSYESRNSLIEGTAFKIPTVRFSVD